MIEIIDPLGKQVIQIEVGQRGGVRIRSFVNGSRYDLYVADRLISQLIKGLQDFQSGDVNGKYTSAKGGSP